MGSVTMVFDRPGAGRPKALAWLTPARCRLGAGAVIGAVFLAHLLYVALPSPVDLAEDETYYWDWSRRLDLSYYSKGPVTAWLIRGSCALLGETPLGVRFPAMAAGAGLMACTWWLTLRLFGSERLALGAVLLGQLAPMVVAAGLVMTTDPPFLLFWAMATCFAAAALWDGKGWGWIGAGMALGLGFLTKFLMPVWLVGMAIFLLVDRRGRAALRGWGPWAMVAVAAAFAPPVLVWNARHGWVTFLHVSEDVGMNGGGLQLRNVVGFWTGQMGVIGPGVFLLAMAASALALYRQWRPGEAGEAEGDRRGERFLLCMGLPVFLAVAATSFRKHAAENWVASAYFALLILGARFVGRQMGDAGRWRWWRLAVYPALIMGAAMSVVAHNTEIIYPAVSAFNERFPGRAVAVRKIDPTHRLHGWREVAEAVAREAARMGPGTLVMAADYQTTAELAFYVRGQPRTYCIGSYFSDPKTREPFSQYDVWGDCRLEAGPAGARGLLGRDAVYVGPMNGDVQRAFREVEALPEIVIVRQGLEVRRLEAWRCRGFGGMAWPGWNGRYNK